MTPAQVADFTRFWAVYPAHNSKQDAMWAWTQMSPDADTLIAAVQVQQRARRQRAAQSKWNPEWPFPATWLRGRRWEDEIADERPPSADEIAGMPTYSTPPAITNDRPVNTCSVAWMWLRQGSQSPVPHGEPVTAGGLCAACAQKINSDRAKHGLEPVK